MLLKSTEVGGNQLTGRFARILIESVFSVLTDWLTQCFLADIFHPLHFKRCIYQPFIKYTKQDRTRQSLSQPILLSQRILLYAEERESKPQSRLILASMAF